MKKSELPGYRKLARVYLERAGIIITPAEARSIEVADFGLGDFERTGLLLLVYVSTDRYCAKELVLLPGQVCPEHRHPPRSGKDPGKQETFRCRWGRVELFLPGRPAAVFSEPRPAAFTVGRRVLLKPGLQYTIPANTRHWFRAGSKGAVVSEFSSANFDAGDIFTDRRVRRLAGEK
ncbi:MAG TPA: D-lyxose/D-mannose family sugar isomerase [bacterium]|uniref:D-lyxose ketol-isomerase n=1 Tax=candidate division TA06 bacterium ADurb.Bin417 TaxID=1852828 RepID=A0A1V5M8R8_UNCT6|nr:MAG: D-lyxose ketol-isomerase [candidate division TA06 bacterium ADurb.Bin417]HNQ34765.1 D-lyxose/D-mannose family sugar isomerase [bacterium]HNS48471.1 D-lyxose/D-mannose family sugar isomerase [bacterium]